MRSEKCYFYDLCDKFKFGKHRGQSLYDVFADDPTYIHWCINTIPNFAFNEAVIQQVKELFPQFIISENFTQHIGSFEDFVLMGIPDDEEYDDTYEEYDKDWQEKPTYERYNGSWAQDEMGYSDDEIDTIFDGDPSAYWNID